MNLNISGRTGISPVNHCLIFLAVTFGFYLMMTNTAAAQSFNFNPLLNLLTSVTSALTGPLGKALATLALIGTAITFYFGVIDLRQAMWVMIAIVIIGSASLIIDSLWGTST